MRNWLLKTLVCFVLTAFAPISARAASDPAAVADRDRTEIRQLLDGWIKAMHNRDIKAIMLMYQPGSGLVAFDIVPPLKYVGFDAYKRDYETFLAQYKGPIDVETRDVQIETCGTVGYAYGLERLSGILVNGQKSDMWIRFTSVFRKVKGRWVDVHDHVSVPVDFDTGKALISLKP